MGFDYMDFRAVFFFILEFGRVFDDMDFRAGFDFGVARTVLPFPDFRWTFSFGF